MTIPLHKAPSMQLLVTLSNITIEKNRNRTSACFPQSHPQVASMFAYRFGCADLSNEHEEKG